MAKRGASCPTNLDRLLDRVTPQHEVTVDAAGCSQAQVERIYDAAKARGLHASGTSRWVLIRHPPRPVKGFSRTRRSR